MVAIRFQALTPSRWKDFESLFGPRGACAGCWYMYWKLSVKDFGASAYEGNRRTQEAIVKAGTVPGILAYTRDEVVGWLAVEPRVKYPRLARSRILKPVDTREVWSVTCFFTRREYRGLGVTVDLLRAAIPHVQKHGGRLVEGYPVEPRAGRIPAAFAYSGLAAAFQKAGYKEVARRSDTRPIFRFEIEGK
jgi:GNAT superfamily N-acetyltransferase